jgi:hypothetical protein
MLDLVRAAALQCSAPWQPTTSTALWSTTPCAPSHASSRRRSWRRARGSSTRPAVPTRRSSAASASSGSSAFATIRNTAARGSITRTTRYPGRAHALRQLRRGHGDHRADRHGDARPRPLRKRRAEGAVPRPGHPGRAGGGHRGDGAGRGLRRGGDRHARRDGDHWVINGSKIFITNAANADWLCVLAVTDPEAGHKGFTQIIVPTDTPSGIPTAASSSR